MATSLKARRRAEPAYRLEDQVGFLIRRAHQRASAIFSEVMAEHEVTPTQLAALVKLSDVGVASQNELGRLTAMDPATVSGVVSRLIKRGAVRQDQNAGDARLLMVSLTDEGERLAETLKAAGREVSSRTLAPLSEEEQAVFLQLLARMG